MRHLFALVAAVTLLVATSASALAVDLRNEGNAEVTVKVRSSAMTKTVTLQPRTLAIVICVGTCAFEAPGMGRVEASGSDVVAIRGGALVRPTPPTVISRR